MSERDKVLSDSVRRILEVVIAAGLVAAVSVYAGSEVTNARMASFENKLVQLQTTHAADHHFHVEQRVRLWNRVNENEAVVQEVKESVAGLRADTQHLIRQIDWFIDRLDGGAKT